MHLIHNSPETLMAFVWGNISIIILAFFARFIWRWMELSKSANTVRPATFDLETVAPYPSEKIKGFEKYRIRMGLKKMDRANWLTVDKDYVALHRIRKSLLETQKEKMVQCLPEAKEACQEALHEVSKFLCKRYPAMFETCTSGSGPKVINKEVGEEFCLSGCSGSISPLEIAARLAMDDLTIILKNKEGIHYMAATASCFQIGWSAQERIGETITRMHDPVPEWEKEVGYAVNNCVKYRACIIGESSVLTVQRRFMTRLTPETPMERASYFIQVSHPGQPLPEILFQPEGIIHTSIEPQPEHIIIRKERQSFTRLPTSGGILFAVRTSLTYLPDLPLDELQNMVKEINSWPEEMARYKGREHWGPVVFQHCKQRERETSLSMGTSNKFGT
ncbi:hypothetical protein PRK78_000204 [Emydomyces testavorans]|uniref:Uncharacterized protein n=1 Tax=Emydomyces testavorans TaxID=2070801 RepID=A0AAF0IHG3_9EURO|nr:hypothetical protein PRK78_000204 [Emydomyces testavorans]